MLRDFSHFKLYAYTQNTIFLSVHKDTHIPGCISSMKTFRPILSVSLHNNARGIIFFWISTTRWTFFFFTPIYPFSIFPFLKSAVSLCFSVVVPPHPLGSAVTKETLELLQREQPEGLRRQFNTDSRPALFFGNVFIYCIMHSSQGCTCCTNACEEQLFLTILLWVPLHDLEIIPIFLSQNSNLVLIGGHGYCLRTCSRFHSHIHIFLYALF